MKFYAFVLLPCYSCRSPHGGRGLKCRSFGCNLDRAWSLPAWGAWIEICERNTHREKRKSLPAWGAWIEMLPELQRKLPGNRSLPAWGAWIEISIITVVCPSFLSLPAWGAWIEIHPKTSQKYLDLRRSPHGEHGLSMYKKILKVCISKTRANVDLT